MTATVTTKELFPGDTTTAQMKEEIRLRLKAGASKCWSKKTAEGITLYTEWNEP